MHDNGFNGRLVEKGWAKNGKNLLEACEKRLSRDEACNCKGTRKHCQGACSSDVIKHSPRGAVFLRWYCYNGYIHDGSAQPMNVHSMPSCIVLTLREGGG